MTTMAPTKVAEGSIRLGILKDSEAVMGIGQEYRCRGLDPIGDTESQCICKVISMLC